MESSIINCIISQMKIKEIEKSATEPVSQTLRLHSIPLEQVKVYILFYTI